MLTRAGWGALLGAAALAVAGRVLGTIELLALGTGVAVLVLVAVVVVRTSRLRLAVTRELHPARVHAGTPARVDVRATNAGRRRTPLLRLRDPVSGTQGALLTLAPLRPGDSARAAYRLPTEQRGLVTVGPLAVEVSDPFGLAVVRVQAAAPTELTVYPALDPVPAPPQAGGRDPHAGADSRDPLGRQGNEFHALRPYTVGDDLRRVHWRSTARRGELMVRQDELPWQARLTVVLDTRKAAHDRSSFEPAVSAAASLLAAAAAKRELVRLVATDGGDSGFGGGAAHVEQALEHLATVSLSQAGTLRAAIDRIDRPGAGGTLVAVVGTATDQEVDALLRLSRRYGWIRVVALGGPGGSASRAGVLRVGPGERFADVWSRAVRPAAVPVGAR